MLNWNNLSSPHELATIFLESGKSLKVEMSFTNLFIITYVSENVYNSDCVYSKSDRISSKFNFARNLDQILYKIVKFVSNLQVE